jgi:hypothetical protein
MTFSREGQGVIASILDKKQSRRVCFFFAAYSRSEKLDCIALSHIYQYDVFYQTSASQVDVIE